MCENSILGPPAEMDEYWKILRKYQPKGPLVVAEFYPGWLTHWQESIARVPAKQIVDAMRWYSFSFFCSNQNNYLLSFG